ncbi:hypothetical protein CGT94_17145 [Vibrio metoecus]|uniref:hypothetical protein n=1 Tax=Vibrio metoecus TaxID=1481663 RepID=UPI0006D7FF76|nr:hypothetical protein [Vibrio metoecus]KQA98073.1 hypothetical protein XV93_17600 [Vibrio metoecus]PAR47540.1 hypothetical protein CGT94_17145 [Vibrio metoecus]
MVLKTKELFELPVYRIDEETYNCELKEYISSNESMSPEYSRKQFGGDWQYNEVVGFLRFYVSGKRQIRCEYWQTDTQRKIKTRKKQFVMTSDSFCTQNFYPNADNDALKSMLLDSIEHCRVNLPRRHIDMRMFMETFDFIDWCRVLA